MAPLRVAITLAAFALGLTGVARARPATSYSVTPAGQGLVRPPMFARPPAQLRLRVHKDDDVLRRANDEAARTFGRTHSADEWHLYDAELNRRPQAPPPGRLPPTVDSAGVVQRIQLPTAAAARVRARARSDRHIALARRLRLVGGTMPRPRQPISWFTYYHMAHRSPYVRPLIKATSIALGAKIRGYYSLTFGVSIRSGGNRPPSFAPVVRGW